ncbi:hypothetical protein TNCV_1070121 [Trichonephila clavipes]|nr:hypothetical protein TNCV_1070121 [Trichonephila clavipes]
MVYGDRPRPIHEQRLPHVSSGHIVRNSQSFEECNRKKHLPIESIRIVILLRMSQEQYEAPWWSRPWAWAQLAHALRRFWAGRRRQC